MNKEKIAFQLYVYAKENHMIGLKTTKQLNRVDGVIIFTQKEPIELFTVFVTYSQTGNCIIYAKSFNFPRVLHVFLTTSVYCTLLHIVF